MTVVSGVVFDCKSYDRQNFLALKDEYEALGVEWVFQEARLSHLTVSLALNSKIICCFVNDEVGADVVRQLAKFGVKLILLRCAGFDNVDLEECKAVGIQVERVPAYSPNAIAEHALGLILTMQRKFHVAFGRTRNGDFSLSTRLLGHDVSSLSVGIVGTGKIGKILARTLWAMGSKVFAYDAAYKDRDLSSLVGGTGTFQYVDSLDDLWAQCDIVSLHVPLIEGQTRHLINDDSLAKMKRGVCIVNTSRGGLIDTSALIRGLKSQQVGSCALDVYEGEKGFFHQDWTDSVIPDDTLTRLMTFNNVLITPHQAYFTHEALMGIGKTTLENCKRFILSPPQ